MNVLTHPQAHRTFDDIAETLRYGFKALAATGYRLPDRTVMLGAHLLPWDTRPDAQRILYNFEQRDSGPLTNSALHLYRQHEVWDYSASNVAWLAEHGVKAKHVPVGFVPELQRIQKVAPDIDVLFYGLVNTRRRRLLDDLRAAGLRVYESINSYGHDRDNLIARSKIVLNVHFYETGIFEIVRCSYLFANKVCVVSEQSIDVPPELSDAAVFAYYDQLVDVCLHVIRQDWAAEWATRAYEAFRTCDETAILRGVLDGTHP